MPEPVTILIAACRDFNGIPSVYTRDDVTGDWIETQIAPIQTSKATIRSLALYRDKTNNADLVFAGCLPQGLIAGVYNPILPGKIRWRSAESTASNTNIGVAGSGSWQGRPMAFTECNGSLYCAVAPIILKRNDVTKTWSEVVRYPLSVTPGGSSGLRGLTTVPNPTGTGQSLISALEGGNGAMYRTTPTVSTPFPNIPTELNIMTNLTNAWTTIPPAITATYVVVANSEMTPVIDPLTGENCLIITIQHHPALARDDAFYYIRRQNGATISYQLMRINNNLLSPPIVLNSTRACQLSPFPSDNNNYAYIAGFDADDNWTHNSAYVLRTSISTLFGYDGLGLVENVTNEVDKGLLIYPNPAINELIIETLNNNWLNANVIMLDLNGRIIKNNVLSTFGENKIDVQGISSGTYLVKINSEKESFSKKIIIK